MFCFAFVELRYLWDIQVEMSYHGTKQVGLKFSREIRARYVDLGVVCIEMRVESLGIGEDYQERVCREKSKRPKTETWDMPMHRG